MSLQSLAIQPQSITYPPPNQPPSQDEEDGGTDESAEREISHDHRSEAGETSSSLGKRRAGATESEGPEDEDSPRPKKVSKKTQIACNFRTLTTIVHLCRPEIEVRRTDADMP